MSTEPTKPPSPPRTVVKEVAKGIAGDFFSFLKWTLAGAIVGAVLLGGAGWYLLSLEVGLYAAVAGAVIGGGATLWFYGSILG